MWLVFRLLLFRSLSRRRIVSFPFFFFQSLVKILNLLMLTKGFAHGSSFRWEIKSGMAKKNGYSFESQYYEYFLWKMGAFDSLELWLWYLVFVFWCVCTCSFCRVLNMSVQISGHLSAWLAVEYSEFFIFIFIGDFVGCITDFFLWMLFFVGKLIYCYFRCGNGALSSVLVI